jgi:hypothetical protein
VGTGKSYKYFTIIDLQVKPEQISPNQKLARSSLSDRAEISLENFHRAVPRAF